MVEWSIEACRASGSVGSIVVARPPGLVHGLDADDLRMVEGGATRAQSVSNALRTVDTEFVAIHDAARPLVTPELIDEVVATLVAIPGASGAIAATPVTDTIKQAEGNENPGRNALSVGSADKALHQVEVTLDRTRLWAAQTPQVFRVDALREALAGDPDRVDAATDESMLIEAAGGRVLIHPSPAENFKVTTPLDLKLAHSLLSERSAQ
jgi:2-C-methyl-D-erythritol 4-phosphate cytidylyltransferase